MSSTSNQNRTDIYLPLNRSIKATIFTDCDFSSNN